MIPNGAAYNNFPPFAINGTKTPPGGSPESAKYALGMVPADTFPAEWANYLFYGATAGITRLNADAGSMKKEINSVLENFNITPDVTIENQLMAALTKLKAEAALAAHPVGSLYWTSVNENPAVTFGGGTWTRIKDKFVWAMGDDDTVNATGGAKTVTLEVANLPSHNHSFTGTAVTSGANNRGHTHSVTAAGTITVKTNPTFAGTAVTSGANSRGHTHSVTASGSVSAHAHGLNNHTHSFTPAGSVKVTTNPTFTGSAVNTGGMSENSSGYIKFTRYTPILDYTSENQVQGSGNLSIGASNSLNLQRPEYNKNTNNERCVYKISSNVAHTHSVTASGTISGGAYTFTGTAGTTGGNSGNTANTTPTFTGKAVTSGAESQNHTHSVTAAGTISGGAYTFTGSAVTSGGESQNHTHSVTAAGTIGNTGSGTAVNKMPPYICKYCWERTA